MLNVHKGGVPMLARRETKLDWLSAFMYCLLPLPSELQRIKDLFPEEKILEAARLALRRGV